MRGQQSGWVHCRRCYYEAYNELNRWAWWQFQDGSGGRPRGKKLQSISGIRSQPGERTLLTTAFVISGTHIHRADIAKGQHQPSPLPRGSDPAPQARAPHQLQPGRLTRLQLQGAPSSSPLWPSSYPAWEGFASRQLSPSREKPAPSATGQGCECWMAGAFAIRASGLEPRPRRSWAA